MKKSLILVLMAFLLAAMPAFAQTAPEYHVGVNGQRFGPYDIAALKDLAQTGALTGTSLIWREGMAGWVEAATVPEILSALLTAPQPAPNGKIYRIGDKGPNGGIIIYDKGVFSDGWRYLEATPVRTEIPARIPDKILSAGALSKAHLENFLLARNPSLAAGREYVSALIAAYIEYANRDGVNYEIAFAQMCYHTNYLSFDRPPALAWPYNYAGISSSYSPNQAYRFNSLEEGVKAHIQHLKGYATREPPVGVIVDPRYSLIKETHGLGSSPTLAGLEGRWSSDKGYGRALQDILTALYEMAKK